MGTITLRWKVAAAVLATVLAACGGGDDDDGDGGASAGSTADAQEAVTPEGAGDAEGAAGEADSGEAFSCAITAEQVGEVLGAAVEKNPATCSFAPGGNAGSVPTAAFIAQMPQLCDATFANQLGYTERLDEMFGGEAYIQTGGAADAQVLVCSDAAFEVVVDDAEEGSATAETAAETLALIAMEAE
jgi:hypothetical protein